MKGEILLVPVGVVPSEVCGWLLDALPAVFDCASRLGPALPHPALAWDARRRQYLADAILARVQREGATCALALADLDLYTPGLNFCFGLADALGRRAIIALPRLRQSFYGQPGETALFRERVTKEAVHELGHVHGLGHCPDRRCVMAFSNTLADTDEKGREFCARCRSQMRK